LAKLYLIRHARPAASWTEEPDAGLDPIGVQQAEAAARTVAQLTERAPIFTSPLRRCRETAQPLERLWQQTATVFEPVAEIPSPPLALHTRQQWLQQAMQSTWRQLHERAAPGSPDYLGWRERVLEALVRIERDSVIFSHFIAINVAVGAAQSREEVVCFRPDHASITCVETRSGKLHVIQRGREARTTVQTRG
jgi:broad specificity phosphatase PhoE